MSINQTKEPITLYMVTEQDADTILYFHVGTKDTDMYPSWSKGITDASLFQTEDEALDQASQHYCDPEAMTRVQSIKCYRHALCRSMDEDDTCLYLLYPERNCASLTRYIVCRERDGKEQYHYANDPRWKPIELYNDLMPEDACIGDIYDGYCDSVLDTQLFYTYEGALSVAVAEGQGWKVREIVVPTHCVNYGSKQAPFEYLIVA